MRLILTYLERCNFAENELERGVQELFGPISKRITLQAIDAIQTGSDERLGALMVAAQRFFDRYAVPACPEELTAPVLHKVLQYDTLKPYICGGKGVGSQGDGFYGLVIEGRRYDIGLPEHYKETLLTFASS